MRGLFRSCGGAAAQSKCKAGAARRSPSAAAFIRSWAGALLACLLILQWKPCAAQEAAERAAAQALYDQGIMAMHAGKPAEACPKFEQSQRLDPGVGTLLHMADCYEALGRTASAWATFLDAAYAAKSAGQAERQSVAEQNATRLKASLSYLVVSVSSPRAPGLVMSQDGKGLAQGLWGVQLPTDPGEHELKASAPGYEPWSATVQVPAGPGSLRVEVPALLPGALPPPVASGGTQASQGVRSASPLTSPDTNARSREAPGAGWWLVGGGAVLAAAGGGFIGWGYSDDKAADSECRRSDASLCSERGVRLGKSARLKTGAGLVGAGVGLAAIASGLLWGLTASDGEDASLAVLPSARGGIFFSAEGRF